MDGSQILAAVGALATAFGLTAGGVAAWRNAKATGVKTDAEVRDGLLAHLVTRAESADARSARTEERLDQVQSTLDREREHSFAQDKRMSRLERVNDQWHAWYRTTIVAQWPLIRLSETPPTSPETSDG